MKRSIITAVVVADVDYKIERTADASAEVKVDLQEVAASLGASYSLKDENTIKGASLTVAYRDTQEERFIWPDVKACK